MQSRKTGYGSKSLHRSFPAIDSLEGEEGIGVRQLAEAVQYCSLGRTNWV